MTDSETQTANGWITENDLEQDALPHDQIQTYEYEETESAERREMRIQKVMDKAIELASQVVETAKHQKKVGVDLKKIIDSELERKRFEKQICDRDIRIRELEEETQRLKGALSHCKTEIVELRNKINQAISHSSTLNHNASTPRRVNFIENDKDLYVIDHDNNENTRHLSPINTQNHTSGCEADKLSQTLGVLQQTIDMSRRNSRPSIRREYKLKPGDQITLWWDYLNSELTAMSLLFIIDPKILGSSNLSPGDKQDSENTVHDVIINRIDREREYRAENKRYVKHCKFYAWNE